MFSIFQFGPKISRTAVKQDPYIREIKSYLASWYGHGCPQASGQLLSVLERFPLQICLQNSAVSSMACAGVAIHLVPIRKLYYEPLVTTATTFPIAHPESSALYKYIFAHVYLISAMHTCGRLLQLSIPASNPSTYHGRPTRTLFFFFPAFRS